MASHKGMPAKRLNKSNCR